jgi:hypothetical protein
LRPSIRASSQLTSNITTKQLPTPKLHYQLHKKTSSIMQFIVAASLFAAALAAPMAQTSDCPNPAHCGEPSPTVYENIDISDYTLRKDNGVIQSVNFKLKGDETPEPILCSVGPTPTFPSETVTCGDSNYRVILIAPKDPSTGDADLAIYHQTGQASGLWAEAPAPATYCHAGGNGVNDFICTEVPDYFYTVVITPSG